MFVMDEPVAISCGYPAPAGALARRCSGRKITAQTSRDPRQAGVCQIGWKKEYKMCATRSEAFQDRPDRARIARHTFSAVAGMST
jgi:hypothetical protein